MELDGLLQRKIERPQLDIHDEGKGVVNAVLELLQCETDSRTFTESQTSYKSYRR